MTIKRLLASILIISFGATVIVAIYASNRTAASPPTGWKHIIDRDRVKFEMDYPEYLTPGFETHNVQFGEEARVSSVPGTESDLQSIIASPEPDVLTGKTKIGGHEAFMLRQRWSRTRLSTSYSVVFFANGRIYSIFIPRPELGHDKRMLASFKVTD